MEWLLKTYKTYINIEFEKIFFLCLCGIIVIFIANEIISIIKVKSCCPKQQKCTKINDSLYDEKKVAMELHFAAAKCYKNPKNVRRCMEILNKFPYLVNYPLAPNGFTPFLRVCMQSCDELIAFMLDKGADVEICTSDGDNPIYLTTFAIVTKKAASFSSLEMLLEKGCPINKGKRNGFTALHVAARHGHDGLTRWLLLNGADPNPSYCATSPYSIAKKYGHEVTADLLFINVGQLEFTNIINSCRRKM